MPARLALCLLLLSSTVAEAQEPPAPSMELLDFLAGPEASDEAWWEEPVDSGATDADDEDEQRYEAEQE